MVADQEATVTDIYLPVVSDLPFVQHPGLTPFPILPTSPFKRSFNMFFSFVATILAASSLGRVSAGLPAKIYGVNLGSWLVLEPWMLPKGTPSILTVCYISIQFVMQSGPKWAANRASGISVGRALVPNCMCPPVLLGLYSDPR